MGVRLWEFGLGVIFLKNVNLQLFEKTFVDFIFLRKFIFFKKRKNLQSSEKTFVDFYFFRKSAYSKEQDHDLVSPSPWAPTSEIFLAQKRSSWRYIGVCGIVGV